MADINVRIDADKDLTTFTVEGDLTASEIIQYSSEYYVKYPTVNVLWDVTKGSVKKISREEFRNIAAEMKKYTLNRSGGLTALVGKADIDFGLGRQYESYSELALLDVKYHIFRNVEDALGWLKV